MIETATSYVFLTPEGGWRIGDSRVSLDSVIIGYSEGQNPEAIREDYPALSLEQIHGAIAFYLHNKEELDRYLTAQEVLWEDLRKRSEADHGPLFKQLRERRQAASPPEQLS